MVLYIHMLAVRPLSQRDPKWGSKRYAKGPLTIGKYGCALTCLAMMADVSNVATANEQMVAKGGYLGNLVYWPMVPKGLPKLKFVFRSYVYDNNQVKHWIYNRGFPVIVQVDAAPIGAPRSDHYVLFIGDHKCIDPWTGKIRPTSDFSKTNVTKTPLKGYILYEIQK